MKAAAQAPINTVTFPRPGGIGPVITPALMNAELKADLDHELEDKLSSEGVVTVKSAEFKPTNEDDVYTAKGKVKVDALWGGANTYEFTAKINRETGEMTDFKRKLVGSTD